MDRTSDFKKECTLCNRRIIKLTRHLRQMHPIISDNQRAKAIGCQRITRKDCKVQTNLNRVYRLCNEMKVSGELCRAIVLEHGLVNKRSLFFDFN